MRARFDVRWAGFGVTMASAVLAVACSNSDSGGTGSVSASVGASTTTTTTSGSSGSGGATSASTSVQASVQSVVASSTTGAGGAGGSAPAACVPGGMKECSFYELQDMKLADVAPTSMSTYKGKVLFVFNAAELCGYTFETTGIQNLQKKYEAQGFTVLGFYSNDFGMQAGNPASCNSKFGVTFDTFEIAPVKGPMARPVFAWFAAAKQSPGPEATQAPQWNFSKYLIARDGTWVKHWNSGVLPEDAAVTSAIEAELAKK